MKGGTAQSDNNPPQTFHSLLFFLAELFTFVWTLLKKRIEFLFRLFHRLCLPRISSLALLLSGQQHRLSRASTAHGKLEHFVAWLSFMIVKTRCCWEEKKKGMLKAKTWQIRTQKIKSERRINCLRGNFGAALFFTVRSLLLPNNMNSFGTQSVWPGPSWVTDHRRSSRSCSVECIWEWECHNRKRSTDRRMVWFLPGRMFAAARRYFH